LAQVAQVEQQQVHKMEQPDQILYLAPLLLTVVGVAVVMPI
jgi:hypothetical protein